MELTFSCASEPFAHGLPCEKRSGGAPGETPKQLGASKTLKESRLSVYTTLVCQTSSYTPAPLGSAIPSVANANQRFPFRGARPVSHRHAAQTLSVEMSVNNPDWAALSSSVESQPTLNPDLMIS